MFKVNIPNILANIYAAKSHTHGNITNDGKLGTASRFVVTDSNKNITVQEKLGNITLDGKVGTTASKPLITTTNGVVTTGSFGSSSSTSATEFVACNDTRLSNARTPTSHTHGSLTNDGKVGSASGKIITTGTGGAIQASDSITKSQISDFPSSMTPSSHNQATTTITNSETYSNLGSNLTNQKLINDAINTKIGALLDIELVTVVTSLGTASSSTMNKLYLVAESSSKTNDAYEIYVTVRTGTSGSYSYAWEKVDTARIDLSGYSTTSHTHGNITSGGKLGTANRFVVTDSNKNITVQEKLGNITLDGKIGTASGKIITTGTNGVLGASDSITKSMISDFPTSMTPASHTHGSLTNDGKLGSASGKIVTTGTNGVIQASDSITKSMISDFPSSMTPASHTHGNVTNDGKVGSTANKPLITTTGGAITTGSFGSSTSTSSTEFVACSDSRLSDSRTPTSHTHGSLTNDGKLGSASGKIVTTGTNGVIQASDSITKSMISDFPSSMTPASHTHGNITNDGKLGTASRFVVTDSNKYITVQEKLGNITLDGKVGTTANKPLITTTGGTVTTGSFGSSTSTSSTDFVACSDSRLSDARTPTSHSHGNIANGGTVTQTTTTATDKIATIGASDNKIYSYTMTYSNGVFKIGG